MHPVNYLTFLSLTAVVGLSLVHPGWASFAPLVFAFVCVPVVDALVGTLDRNPTEQDTARWARSSVWGALTYGYVLTHFLVLGYALWTAANVPWWAIVGVGISTGIYTGSLGITVAHELAHKRGRTPQLTAYALLVSVWYHHFAIEHVRGHHVNVATPDDPASAAFGENAFAFLRRSVSGSFRDALALERRRVGKSWSWRNHIVLGVGAQLVLTALVAMLGAKALVVFLLQAAVAITLLELINYIEHYGLSRRRLANRRFERVTPVHSWNSSHRFTNALLFNLQRHSDHHATAMLPFTVLKHHDRVPQLPFGYPTMVLIALCPPLWFRIMNPRVNAWLAESERAAG